MAADLQPTNHDAQTGGVRVGDVHGGIHGSKFAGRDLYDTVVNLFFGSAQAQDRRNQLELLRRVQDFWIAGFLDSSLQSAALIDLHKEALTSAVEHPWDGVLQTPAPPSGLLPSGTPIIDLFDDMGHALLILGEPGSGKTITLLELARDAIARAQADPAEPIPVVFHLSSWAEKRQPLVEWLTEELVTKYQIAKRIGRPWLEQQLLLLLLDGLDEVDPAHRQACAQAINIFRRDYGLTGIVVCCRTAEYEALGDRLKLGRAILVRPPTPPQVDAYLASAGPRLAALRVAVQRDGTLAELAQTPLMLSVMVLVCRDLPAEALVSALPTDLFAAYVSHMFKRRGVIQPYKPQQTVAWLTWLAQRLEQHSQTLFLLEQLQPSWLIGRAQRWLYVLGSRTIGGLLVGLAVLLFLFGLYPGLYRMPAATFPLGYLAAGLAVGLVDGARFERHCRSPTSRPARRGDFWPFLINLLLIGLAAALAFSLATMAVTVSYAATRGYHPTAGPIAQAYLRGLPAALLLSGLPFCLVWGMRRRGLAAGADVKTIETLSWSWRRFLFSLVLLGLIPAVVTLAFTAHAYEPGVRLWDSSDGRPIAALGSGGRSFPVLAARFSPDGTRLLTAYELGPVRLWNGRDGHPIAILEDSYVAPELDRLPVFSPDGTRLATPGVSQTPLLWDSTDGRLLATLDPTPADRISGVWPVAFSRDGTRLLTASDYGPVRLWNGMDGTPIATIEGRGYVPPSFSPDGKRVLTCGGHQAWLWDATGGGLLATLSRHNLSLEFVAFSPTGTRILTYDDMQAILWDGHDGHFVAALGEWGQIGSSPQSAVFSRDDARLATIRLFDHAELWDGQDGSFVTDLADVFDKTYSATFSPDGTRLVTAHHSRAPQLRDARTGEPIAPLEGYGWWEFSHDGTRLVSSVGRTTLRLWESRDGRPIATLEGSASIRYVAFSPVGLRLVTSGDERTAHLWDASDGTLLSTLAGHKHVVQAATFSPDGTRIVTTGIATTDYRPTALLWLVPGIGVGLLGGLRGAVRQHKVSPNQGIRLTARNAALLALALGLIFTLLAALGVWTADRLLSVLLLSNVDPSSLLPVRGFIMVAVLAGLAYGGLDFLHYCLLRCLLAASGRIPWHTVRFLNYAGERIFLRKVGGGYLFVHRLLQDYFAAGHLKGAS